MNAPRLEINLDAITHNARSLVERLGSRGARVTGVTKAALGSPAIGAAMLRGGVSGLADSRIENLARLRATATDAPLTLMRSPMLSQADQVVQCADISLNTEGVVLDALSAAAERAHVHHGVVLMAELGDLREGVDAAAMFNLVRQVRRSRNLTLTGIGTNLACQSGVVPDQRNMDELSRLADQTETIYGSELPIVSGGNSANIGWALETDDLGRITDLRLGESILLGTEPLQRSTIDGLRTDAFTLIAEVIEVNTKPSLPWGALAQNAFGSRPGDQHHRGTRRQAIVALGRQDVDPEGIVSTLGAVGIGMSSDHLLLDIEDHEVAVGDELAFRLNYSALLRAMTSPFVATSLQDTRSRTRLQTA